MLQKHTIITETYMKRRRRTLMNFSLLKDNKNFASYKQYFNEKNYFFLLSINGHDNIRVIARN
jgi:hypothetical protein